MSSTYYDTCPDCGAHLDPGERCDCHENDDSDDTEKHTEQIGN